MTLIIIALMLFPVVLTVENEYVLVGSYVSLPCYFNSTLKGHVFYMFLSWDADNALAYLFNGRLIRNKGTAVFKKAKKNGFEVDRVSGENKMILAINHVSLKYKDLEVTCLVKDDDGRGAVVWKQTTKLTVIDPPKILRFAKDVINVTRGSSRKVELICVATGHPPPMVRWRKQTEKAIFHPQTFNKETLTARCLLPTPFTDAQDGHFLCEAITSDSYMRSIGVNKMISAIKVNVHYAPEIHVKDQLRYTDVGRTVSILISLAGNPEPQLRCNLFDIRNPKYMRIRDHPSPHRYTYEVILPNVRLSSIGDYRCVASNYLGTDWTRIRLRLGPSRPVIISFPITSFSNYFLLRWKTLSLALLNNCTVELSTRNKSGSVVSVRSSVVPLRNQRSQVTNRTFTYHMTNLSAATQYSVRVRTCNRHQCSDFSRALRFWTANFTGGNTVDPRALLAVVTTKRPSNVQPMKRCSPYGFGSTVCTAESLVASKILVVVPFFTAWMYY